MEEALGENLAVAILESVRLTELSVHLPRMEVPAMQEVAAREGRAVDTLLASQLLDFVSAEADWLACQIPVSPVFAEAMEWPGEATEQLS